MRISLFILSLFLTASFMSPSLASDNSKKAHHDEKPHWSYDGKTGPEKWAYLNSQFQACGVGQYQSPIDIRANVDATLPAITLDYKDIPTNVINNGHTIQVNYLDGSTMTVGDDVYDLLQFHFHTPSEYAIDGKRADMEVHFVHKRQSDDALGVLSVMMNVGSSAHKTIETIWSKAPVHKGENRAPEEMISAASLIPSDLGYFRLMGSLTTPPCSEGVNWHVLAEPITISRQQLEKFKTLFPMNARRRLNIAYSVRYRKI